MNPIGKRPLQDGVDLGPVRKRQRVRFTATEKKAVNVLETFKKRVEFTERDREAASIIQKISIHCQTDTLARRAHQHFLDRNFAAALQDCNEILEIPFTQLPNRENHIRALVIKGAIFSEQGELNSAYWFLTLAIVHAMPFQRVKDLSEIYIMRGLVALRKGELDFALNDFNQSLVYDCENPYALPYRAEVFMKQNRDLEAGRDLCQALWINPNCYFAWNKVGELLLKRGKLVQAKAAFDQAIELYPTRLRNNTTLCFLFKKEI